MDISRSWTCHARYWTTCGLGNQGEIAYSDSWFCGMVRKMKRSFSYKLCTRLTLVRRLFKDARFLLVFSAGAVGTFPLFVAPFFLPLYSQAIGLSTSTGAGLLAGFNFSSAVGRIICGLLCDKIGALNTLFISLMLTALSMLALWPASTTLAPLAVFVVINGAGNGGFFSTMPTVVGNVFGSARVSVAMGMVVTGWGGGYLMVRALITGPYRSRPWQHI